MRLDYFNSFALKYISFHLEKDIATELLAYIITNIDDYSKGESFH